MCGSGFRVLLGAMFFLLHVPGAYAVESNFWQDRRSRSSERLKSPPTPFLASTSFVSSAGDLVPGRFSSPLFLGPSERSYRSSSGLGGLSSGKSEKIEWITSSLAAYGDIREVFQSSNPAAPMVIHLQDIHDIEEAQRNLAGILDALQREGGVDFVGLEGAVGPFHLEPYRASPFPDVTKTMADAFLKLGYLSGPEVAAITAKKVPFLWGVEDLGLYGDHIKAFQESEDHRSSLRESFNRVSFDLNEAQERFYSPELRALENHRKAYQSNREPLTSFVDHLWRVGTFNEIDFPNISLLLRSMDWEKKLDLKIVEKERAEFVKEITRKVPEAALVVLIQKSADYRKGSLPYGAHYRFLQPFCLANGISVASYTNFNNYISYVLLAERIQREALIDELESLDLAADSLLARTPEQKFLVAARRSLGRVDQLISHKLSPSEWYRYQKDRKFLEKIPGELSLLLGRPLDGVNSLTLESLAPFEKFCERALDRNKSLVENLLEKMKSEGRSSGVLVAGGFHTEGMVRLLRQKGVSFVVVTPRLSRVPEGGSPLDVFSRQPRPLEKLLAGDVIHLNFPLQTQAGTEAANLVSTRADGFLRQETSHVLWSSLRYFLEKLKRGFQGDNLEQFESFASPFKTIVGVSSRVFEFKGRSAMAVRVRKRNGTEQEFLIVSEPQGSKYVVDLPKNPLYQSPFLLDEISTMVSLYDFNWFGPMEFGPVSWAREYIPDFWISNRRAIRRFVPRLLGGLLYPSWEVKTEARMEEAHDAFIQRAIALGVPATVLNGIAAHMRRSRELANRISRDLNLSSGDRNDLRLAAIIHDTGKFHPDCVHSIASRAIFGPTADVQEELQKHESVVFEMMEREELPITENVARILKVHSALGPRSNEQLATIPGVTDRHIRLALLLAMIDVSDGYRDMHRPYIQTRVITNNEGFPTAEQLRREFQRYSNKLRETRRPYRHDLSEWADRKYDELLKKTWFRIATEKTLFEFIALRATDQNKGGDVSLTEHSFQTVVSDIAKFDLFSRDTPMELWWRSVVESVWLQGNEGLESRGEILQTLLGFLENSGETISHSQVLDLRFLTRQMMSFSFQETYPDPETHSSALVDDLESLFKDHRYLDFEKLGWALTRFVKQGISLSKPGHPVTVRARNIDGNRVFELRGVTALSPLTSFDSKEGQVFPLSGRNFKGRDIPTALLPPPSISENKFSLELVVPFSTDDFAAWHVSKADIETVGGWLEKMFEWEKIRYLNIHLMVNTSLSGPMQAVRYEDQTTIFLNPHRASKKSMEKAMNQIVAGVPELRAGGPVFDLFSEITMKHLGIKPTRFNSLLNMFVGHSSEKIKNRPWLHLGGAVVFENSLRVAYIAGFYSLALWAGVGALGSFYVAYVGGGVILWALTHKIMNLFLRNFFPHKKVQTLTWTDALYKIPASFLVSVVFLSVGFYIPLENLAVLNQVMALVSSPVFLGAVTMTTLFQSSVDAYIAFSKPHWGRHLLNMFLGRPEPEIIPPPTRLIFSIDVNEIRERVSTETRRRESDRQYLGAMISSRSFGSSLAVRHRAENVSQEQRRVDLQSLALEVAAFEKNLKMNLSFALREMGEGYNREMGLLSFSEAVESALKHDKELGIEVSASLFKADRQAYLNPQDIATRDQLRLVSLLSESKNIPLTLIVPENISNTDVSSFLERQGIRVDLKYSMVSKTRELLNAESKYSVEKLMKKVQGVTTVSELRPMMLFFHDANEWAIDPRLAQLLSLFYGDLYYDVQKVTGDQLTHLVAVLIQA